MFKNKVSQIINLFEELLNENTVVWKQIVDHFLLRLKEVWIIFIQDKLELFQFNWVWVEPDYQSQFYLKLLNILDSLKISIWTIENYYLIDEVCVFHKINSTDLKPILFLTMINDRKPKTFDEKTALYKQLLEDVSSFEQSFDTMIDWQVYVNLDWESKVYDIFVKKWNYFFWFNNYSFSLNQLGDNFNVSPNNIVKKIISVWL